MFTFSPLQITLASAVSDVQKQIIEVQNQLSSGKRNLNAGEYGIVTRLTSQASAYDTTVKNITAAQQVVSVGQTTLSSIVTIATQMKNLATQGASGGLDDPDRQSLATSFSALFTQFDTLTTAASINNSTILGTDGISVLYDPSTPTAQTFDGVDIATAYNTTNMSVSNAVSDATSSTYTAAKFTTAIDELTQFLNTVSTAQGSLTAYNATLEAMATGAKSISSGLNSTVDSIQNIDSTAMQAKLQSLNNQQSIDYYLVSQMNTESAAILAIFR